MDEHERAEQVKRAATGDADAWQHLVVYYHAPLRRQVDRQIETAFRRRLCPEDILQQAYISAFKALDQNRERQRPAPQQVAADASSADQNPERERGATAVIHFNTPAGFYKWLEAIALNQLRDAQRALRRQKRDVAREVHGSSDAATSYPQLIERLTRSQSTPSRHLARTEAIAAVMSSLARLTDEQRNVVRLRFLESRSVAEVAAKLGKSEAAIHMACHRGLKALRELMEPITHYLSRL